MSSDPRDFVLVTPSALSRLIQERADGVVLLHVADGDPGEGIEGAVRIDAETDLAGVGGGLKGARPLPDIADLQANARRWGIRRTSAVIVYDDKGGLLAARAWWVLRWAGIADVRLLDGGLGAWQDDGFGTGALSFDPVPGDVVLSAGHLPVLDADGAARQARDGILLDARAAAAFEGDPERRSGGHIPGSLHAPASGNIAADGRFLAADLLRARYGAAGVDGSQSIGATCGSGVSAAHCVAALATLGIEAALFPGSWSAWSADPDRPVAYGRDTDLAAF